MKHSQRIRDDVGKIIELKKKYSRLEKKRFINIAQKQCVFLYSNYTNIFNKVIKDNLDLSLLNKFLIVLKSIEDGKCDQHEASYKVGQILKQIYIDSAVREANANDNKYKNKKEKIQTKETS